MNKTNSIFIFSRTITYDYEFQKYYGIDIPPDYKSKYVRFLYNFFVVEYIPLSRTRGRVKIANNIDMKFSFLPYFVLHRTTVMFGLDYFKNVIKVNEKFENSGW